MAAAARVDADAEMLAAQGAGDPGDPDALVDDLGAWVGAVRAFELDFEAERPCKADPAVESGKAGQMDVPLAQRRKVSEILISIAHCRSYATAFATAVRRGGDDE